jgi:tetratricopeptide (TPR) repeat protein
MLAYQLRHRETSESLVLEAQALVEKNGLRNTLAIQLFAGLGALGAMAGNYGEARDHYMLAYRIAGNLDNDTQGARAAANAALCLGRLGEYNDQVLWAERALAKIPYSDHPLLLQALTYSGFGHAMLGQRAPAQDCTQRLLSHFVGYPTRWLEQRCYLACADIYQLLGSAHDAEECAMRATTNGLGEPLALGLLGSHARWTAWLASRQCISASRARQVLAVAAAKREISDALDRVEILCAVDRLTPLGLDQRTELEESLRRMPGAVRDQLVRLDAL